jgi:uncharacterized damage-inducible protein DinB
MTDNLSNHGTHIKDHCLLMAQYHEWAYCRLNDALRPIDDTAYRKDHGLFFGSIHGTLNHLLLVDKLWFGRFVDEIFPVESLGQELEADREKLSDALAAQARRWQEFIGASEEPNFGGALHYYNTKGKEYTLPYAPTILHVFNHGTHHRGQISTAITQLGHDAPEMDLPYYMIEMLRAQEHA